MVSIQWGNCGSEQLAPAGEIEKLINCLSGFRPEVREISECRIVLVPCFDGISADPIIFEGPADDMIPLIQVAGWYREARNSPVFVSLKSRTDFSLGMTPARLCAN